MGRPETLSREELLRRIARVFRGAGYDGASLTQLSAETGLAKAALYHRYPGGKEDMALAVLGETELEMATDVMAALSGPGGPAERIAAMAAALDSFYAGGARPCLVDIFSVDGTPKSVRQDIAAGVGAWIASIAAVLVEAGFSRQQAARRAEDAVIRIEGALVLSRALNDTEPFCRMIERLPADLLSNGPNHPTRNSRNGVSDATA